MTRGWSCLRASFCSGGSSTIFDAIERRGWRRPVARRSVPHARPCASSAAPPAMRRCAARQSDGPSGRRRATPAGCRRCGGGGGTPFPAPRAPRHGNVVVRAPVRARGYEAGRRCWKWDYGSSTGRSNFPRVGKLPVAGSRLDRPTRPLAMGCVGAATPGVAGAKPRGGCRHCGATWEHERTRGRQRNGRWGARGGAACKPGRAEHAVGCGRLGPAWATGGHTRGRGPDGRPRHCR